MKRHLKTVGRYTPEQRHANTTSGIRECVLRCTPEKTIWNEEWIVDALCLTDDKLGTPSQAVKRLCRDDVTARAAAALLDFLCDRSIPVLIFSTNLRHVAVTQCKRECWQHLRELGFSYPVIAAVTRCPHSSVITGLMSHRPTYDIINELPAASDIAVPA